MQFWPISPLCQLEKFLSVFLEQKYKYVLANLRLGETVCWCNRVREKTKPQGENNPVYNICHDDKCLKQWKPKLGRRTSS